MIGDQNGVQRARSLMLDWYRQGLEAVDPCLAVKRSVSRIEDDTISISGRRLHLAEDSRVVGIAFGKAASAMATGLDTVLGDRVDAGIILTKDGHVSNPPHRWRVFEASHPVPDERGVSATREILDVVSGLKPDDVVIVLVSGGGSALLEAPRHPATLQDIQQVTSLLLQAGAPIQHLNAVRSELSEVKGGGLRRAIGEARCVSLILSDVLGNDPRVIASGPTVPRQPNPAQAFSILEKYGVVQSAPEPVVELLVGPSTVSGNLSPDDDFYAVIGDNDIFVDAVADAARANGLTVHIPLRGAEGEARTLAERFLALADEAESCASVVLGGGEATVTVQGDGSGGRNTEFALAAALALDDGKAPGLMVASLASDGQDGSVDAAGAIVDTGTVQRAASLGLDASESLARNDSGGFFERLGELVVPGPTGTNVNDVYIAVRLHALKAPAAGGR